MKVIEQGNYKSDWKMQVKCTAKGWGQNRGRKPCYSLLEVEDGDVLERYYSGDIAGMDSGIYYGFICPVCKCFTELPYKEIPNHVREYAPKYQG